MNTQMTTIEVTPEIAEMLRAGATARQLTLEDYLRTLAEIDFIAAQVPKPTLEEFDRDMDELAAGPEGLPVLPENFSRADIYDDHD